MILVAMFIRLPRLSIIAFQESSRCALKGSLLHLCASNKFPNVHKVLELNSSSFSQPVWLLASHCAFGEGSGIIRKSSRASQYNPLLILIMQFRRNHVQLVLLISGQNSIRVAGLRLLLCCSPPSRLGKDPVIPGQTGI